jgi:uncharacterized membrane protein YeiB
MAIAVVGSMTVGGFVEDELTASFLSFFTFLFGAGLAMIALLKAIKD